MAAASASMFNNPLLSDVTIRQTHNGVTKEYHAHKAILCVHSKWFLKAFSGNFKEATQRSIELHDDDPVHFEMMLRYLYSQSWGSSLVDTWNLRAAFNRNFLLPVGVYTLADKYCVDGLKTLAIEKFPKTVRYSSISECKTLVQCHYAKCADAGCLMGCAIADWILISGTAFIQDAQFEAVAKQYPDFSTDILLAFRRKGGKLW